DFAVMQCELYADLLNASQSQALESWCDQGLSSLRKDDWLSQLRSFDPALGISKKLHINGKLTGFKTAFQDALYDFGVEIINGTFEIPADKLQEYKNVLEF